MCGIVGGVGPNVTEGVVRRMCEAFRHRGPDDLQVVRTGAAVLGMVRLSIVDVAGGRQPFFSADGSKALIGNGEIYNHLELRNELIAGGASFHTRSDIETALELFVASGPESFARLNGMFALAIYDSVRDLLWLARDRFGQKPLYLWSCGSDFYFASEAKALLSHDGFDGELDPMGLDDYLAFRYVPAPRSVWKGVTKLPPGTWACLHAGEWRSKRYFRIEYARQEKRRTKDAAEELWRELRAAVERHLMSERPLGVFLSGGIDSASLVACLKDLGHSGVKTYSVGFFAADQDELVAARRVADHFKTDHTEVSLSADEFWRGIDEAVACSDEPLADLSTVPLLKLAESAARTLVVVLSGEGADEMLAGYRGLDRRVLRSRWGRQAAKMLPAAARDRLRDAPGRLGRWLAGLAESPAESLRRDPHRMTQVFDPERSDAFATLRQFFADRPDESMLDLLLAGMCEWWLPDDLLAKADRMTMAYSLELRCPFLDLEFVDFCRRLPTHALVGWPGSRLGTKVALKLALRRRLPAGIALQKKRGFAMPTLEWARGELRSQVAREIEREDGLAARLLDRNERLASWRALERLDGGAEGRVWAIVVANRWGDWRKRVLAERSPDG